jgi:hypothetical protein
VHHRWFDLSRALRARCYWDPDPTEGYSDYLDNFYVDLPFAFTEIIVATRWQSRSKTQYAFHSDGGLRPEAVCRGEWVNMD